MAVEAKCSWRNAVQHLSQISPLLPLSLAEGRTDLVPSEASMSARQGQTHRDKQFVSFNQNVDLRQLPQAHATVEVRKY